MLTPEQIDSRMAELGDLLWGSSLLDDGDLDDDIIAMRVWERMKAVAEQAKKVSRGAQAEAEEMSQ